jgi:hypothetical protein
MATVSAGAGIAGQLMKNQYSSNLADYQAQVALDNQIAAQQQEQNIVNQGVTSMQQQELKNSQQIGANRARLAASGLDIAVGSPADVLSDTADLGLQDAAAIRNNTVNQAYNASVQVMNDTAQARMAQYNAKNLQNQNMLSTIQTGLDLGGNVLDSFTSSGQQPPNPAGLQGSGSIGSDLATVGELASLL